jgi:lysophospholipase L1-like esterase
LATAHVLGEYPEAGWRCYNRGISGDKIPQLAARWDADCLDLEPDVLSILVGVNDFWHTLTHGYQGTAASYEEGYRALLDHTRDALPDAQLIIGEPFAVPGGSAIGEEWDAFEAYQAAARRVADDYNAVWIPYQSLFDEALRAAPVDYWAPDGVHPSPAGNERMAQAWVEAFRTVVG